MLIFAFSQSDHRQNAWFNSFIAWLLFEVVLNSTSIAMLQHICMPLMVIDDIMKVKVTIIQLIKDFQNRYKNEDNNNQMEGNKGQQEEQDQDHAYVFNSANYIFASTRLAKLYPDTLESKVIKEYSTRLPRCYYYSSSSSSRRVTSESNRPIKGIGQSMRVAMKPTQVSPYSQSMHDVLEHVEKGQSFLINGGVDDRSSSMMMNNDEDNARSLRKTVHYVDTSTINDIIGIQNSVDDGYLSDIMNKVEGLSPVRDAEGGGDCDVEGSRSLALIQPPLYSTSITVSQVKKSINTLSDESSSDMDQASRPSTSQDLLSHRNRNREVNVRSINDLKDDSSTSDIDHIRSPTPPVVDSHRIYNAMSSASSSTTTTNFNMPLQLSNKPFINFESLNLTVEDYFANDALNRIDFRSPAATHPRIGSVDRLQIEPIMATNNDKDDMLYDYDRMEVIDKVNNDTHMHRTSDDMMMMVDDDNRSMQLNNNNYRINKVDDYRPASRVDVRSKDDDDYRPASRVDVRSKDDDDYRPASRVDVRSKDDDDYKPASRVDVRSKDDDDYRPASRVDVRSKEVANANNNINRMSTQQVESVTQQNIFPDTTTNTSASAMKRMLMLFACMPVLAQDIFIHLTSTCMIAGYIQLHIELYHLSKLLIIIPTVVVVIVIHFIIQSGKSEEMIKISRLLTTIGGDKNDDDHDDDDDAEKHSTKDSLWAIGSSRKKQMSESAVAAVRYISSFYRSLRSIAPHQETQQAMIDDSHMHLLSRKGANGTEMIQDDRVVNAINTDYGGVMMLSSSRADDDAGYSRSEDDHKTELGSAGGEVDPYHRSNIYQLSSSESDDANDRDASSDAVISDNDDDDARWNYASRYNDDPYEDTEAQLNSRRRQFAVKSGAALYQLSSSGCSSDRRDEVDTNMLDDDDDDADDVEGGGIVLTETNFKSRFFIGDRTDYDHHADIQSMVHQGSNYGHYPSTGHHHHHHQHVGTSSLYVLSSSDSDSDFYDGNYSADRDR